MNTNKITSFWQWFQSISTALHADPQDATILQELDDKIFDLGHLDWEIGPVDQNHYLAISPGLDVGLLAVTKNIVNMAPACEGWIFLPAKPKKEYQAAFEMTNEDGESIQVDTTEWNYVLHQADNGVYDIEVQPGPIDGDDDTLDLAVEIALTNLVGEESVITKLRDITIVERFADDVEPKSLKELHTELS